MIVGEAGTAAAALAAVAAGGIDLVLMDLRLGDGVDGVEATRRIREIDNGPQVLIVTTYESDADIVSAIQAGATGYLLKDADPEDLVQAIRDADAGETVLSPPIASRLVGRMRTPGIALTRRELEIVGRLAGGDSNRDIARGLSISEATVKSHLVHIFDKLGVDSRTRAVAQARQRGLI